MASRKQRTRVQERMSASQLGGELAEAWLNGNYTYVIDTLDVLPRDYALGALAYLSHYISDDEYASNRLRRQLTDRL